jgi:DNA-binding XRE family transcriptional regulator
MKSKEFSQIRHFLRKTQEQLARMLSVSTKSVQSFEQGWRNIPPYIERQMLLLLSLMRSRDRSIQPCWEILNCPMEWRDKCIAWELKAGHLCWFINGTYCQGKEQRSWGKKIRVCRECEVYKLMVRGIYHYSSF